MFVLLSMLYFIWRRWEIHIEIQFYHRNWIRQTILPTPSLSGTCFRPDTLSSSSYNLTLARLPPSIDVHAGLAMPLGDDCYNFASTIPSSPTPLMHLPRHTKFHLYWRSNLRTLGSRQVALVHSILATQDRLTTSVVFWTDSVAHAQLLREASELHDVRTLYGDRFTVQTVDKKALARGTAMEGHKYLEMEDDKAWLDGDLVRVLVLWAEGGVWVDMDTVMTGRDMRVLGESEWVTQWDCYDKPYQPLNGAMMHFYENSPFLCEMLFAMAHDPAPQKGTTDWGSTLYHKVFRRLLAASLPPFKILPYCFTDGRSCRLDNRLPDPFDQLDETKWAPGRVENLRRKVSSVWSVHLHNQWEKGFPKKGWVESMILSRVEAAEREYRAVMEASSREEEE